MTTISAAQYAPYYTPPRTNPYAAYSGSTPQAASSHDSATNITLSEEARAALEGKDFTTIVSETRTALDTLLNDAGVTSPYKDGKLAIDLGNLDRRALFAVASSAEDKFTADEQKAALAELMARFDAALAGPAAIARITDDLAGLYQAALDFLDEASPEEKQTDAWTAQKVAVEDALKALAANPDAPPDMENDPVADYIQRVETGDVSKPRDFADVARDVRVALDKQYAEADAAGKELVFDKRRSNGQLVDFSKFDSRAVSAIALNGNGSFSAEEVRAAKGELRTRSSAAFLACINNASSSDPSALSKNIISAYSSLSPEVRDAAGWNENLYNAALANYQSASKMTDIMKQLASGNSFAGIAGGTSDSSGGTSLLDFL